MASQLNIYQLCRLLNNLHTITGHKFALLDEEANEVYTSNYMNPFCARVQDSEAGYRKCRACDAEHLRELRPESGLKQYRCHAGLVEAAVPVTENGRIVATLLLGQLLSDEDVDRQWEGTRRDCSWYHDLDGLKRAFYSLRQMSRQDVQACAEIAMACVSEVRFHELAQMPQLSDFQRLTMYIDQHYMERLSLDELSRALSIGKTKLCTLASREGGMTLTGMIARKRVMVARGLLVSSDASVQSIAEAVGIPDYNYFSKVFKKFGGMTPSGYRKRYREKGFF